MTEEENGEKCPCKKKQKFPTIQCVRCEVYWHHKCAGLNGLLLEDLKRLKDWLCPLCYRLPEAVTQETTLATLEKKMTEMKADLMEKIEKKTNDQTKKWSDLFDERDSGTVQQAVTQAVEKTKEKMDYDHVERQKRIKNFVVRGIKEPTSSTPESKMAEDKATVLSIVGIESSDIELVRRVGKPQSETGKPRTIVITVKTPEIAAAIHGHGRGRKFRKEDDNRDVWCNPDLIRADRIADYNAREERKKRRADRNLSSGGRTRSGSFLPSSQMAT